MIIYIQNTRESRQAIMNLPRVWGHIKINSVSTQKQNVKNPENNCFKVFFFLHTVKKKAHETLQKYNFLCGRFDTTLLEIRPKSRKMKYVDEKSQ